MGNAGHSLVQEEITHGCFISLSVLFHRNDAVLQTPEQALFWELCENFVHVLLTPHSTGIAAGDMDVCVVGKLLKIFTCWKCQPMLTKQKLMFLLLIPFMSTGYGEKKT